MHILNCRNIDSPICWSSASLATPEMSREELTRRNSSRELELNPSSRISTRIMSSPQDLLSMILTSRILKKKMSRLLNLDLLLAKKLERDSQRPTEISPALRPTTKLITSDSSSADFASDHVGLYLNKN